MGFSAGWQLKALEKLLARSPELLRFTSDPKGWIQSAGLKEIRSGKSPEQIFQELENASDWAYEYLD